MWRPGGVSGSLLSARVGEIADGVVFVAPDAPFAAAIGSAIHCVGGRCSLNRFIKM
jgi:hypothetical protein